MPESNKEVSPVDVLHMGIQREKDAHAFYAEMAQRIADPGTKAMLEGLAQEELGHRRKLENWLHDNFQRGM
jgi:rubrerythrin